MTVTVLHGVTEYAEGLPVHLTEHSGGRVTLDAENEGGYNGTSVDVPQLLAWIFRHRPDWLHKAMRDAADFVVLPGTPNFPHWLPPGV